MDPVCFQLGNRPIYWYGVLIATAFLACILHCALLGRKEGRPPSFCSDLGLWLMLSGIAGARAGYVIANFSDFAARPWDIVRLDKGGLIFYGGFIAASAALIVFSRVRREKLWPLADFVVTALPLGHAIGRIGCFLNGCCYGKPSNVPWSIVSQGSPRHPTQLYSSVLNIVVYAILLRFYFRKKRDGRIFALYLMLYPAGRFAIEFFRGDERLCLLGLSVAQYICMILFAAGAALWFLLPNKRDMETSRWP